VLEPDEIRDQEFTVLADGYDPDEVDRFKADVAETVAALTTEVENASAAKGDDAPADGAPSSSYADLGRAAKRVFEAAESAKEIVEAAEKEAAELRDEARADRERAAQEFEELEQRRQEHAELERRAQEVIREAAESTRQLLNDASRPREQLVEALAEARRLLVERFDDADGMVESVGQRAEEIAQELEVELPVDFATSASDADATEEDPRFDGLASAGAGEGDNPESGS
jgi:DivIVA domain-containing protein